MLQILYNILQKNKEKVLNNDTLAMKLVDRGLGNILLCCLMHSLYLTYFGHLIECGGNSVGFSDTFINNICWTIGVHIYANKTKLTSTFWEWEYEPVKETFYPALSGKAESEDTMVYLTHVSKIPMYFMVAVALTLCGKLCWSFLLGSFLHDLAGPLDSANKEKVAKPVLQEDEKETLLDETVEIFIRHVRFYNELLMYYIFCLAMNLLGLCWQVYTIVDTVGGRDPQFGFKVLYFAFIEYLKWPIELLRIFPSIAVCKYKQAATAGNIIPYDFICSLPWSQSYLILFATIVLLLGICCIMSFLSFLYHILILMFPYFARRDLKNTLKLHPKSKAFTAMKYLPSGGMFMLILLSKNVQYDQVCIILEKTQEDIMINRGRFNRTKKGIL